jgi:hypothetical protein
MIKANHGNTAVMPHDTDTRNAPILGRQPLSPDHPLNDATPVNIRAIVSNMLALVQRITDLAKHESRTVPSQTGFYPIALLADASGNVLCDEAGVPVVVRAPVDVLAIAPDGISDQGGRTVLFAQPNRLVKRAEAAEHAGTSTSMLKRAEAKGELRAVKVGDRDTAYFMADLNGWMMRRILPRDEKS